MDRRGEPGCDNARMEGGAGDDADHAGPLLDQGGRRGGRVYGRVLHPHPAGPGRGAVPLLQLPHPGAGEDGDEGPASQVRRAELLSQIPNRTLGPCFR